MCPGAILFTPSAFQRKDRSISTSKSSLSHAVDRLQNMLYSEARSRERVGLRSHCCGDRGQEPTRGPCSGGLPEASRGLSRLGGPPGHRPQFRRHRLQQTQLLRNSQFYKDFKNWAWGERSRDIKAH